MTIIDIEEQLYYYGARYLDPKYSMWLSTDPALSDYMAGSDAGCQSGYERHVQGRTHQIYG